MAEFVARRLIGSFDPLERAAVRKLEEVSRGRVERLVAAVPDVSRSEANHRLGVFVALFDMFSRERCVVDPEAVERPVHSIEIEDRVRL